MNAPSSDAEAVKRLNAIIEAECGDTEMVHVSADSLLCDLLRENGYTELVVLYESIGKWYA